MARGQHATLDKSVQLLILEKHVQIPSQPQISSLKLIIFRATSQIIQRKPKTDIKCSFNKKLQQTIHRFLINVTAQYAQLLHAHYIFDVLYLKDIYSERRYTTPNCPKKQNYRSSKNPKCSGSKFWPIKKNGLPAHFSIQYYTYMLKYEHVHVYLC